VEKKAPIGLNVFFISGVVGKLLPVRSILREGLNFLLARKGWLKYEIFFQY